MTGLRSSSATSLKSSPRRDSSQEILERAGVGSLLAPEPADECSSLPSCHELVGVDVRERRDAERRLPDQLGKDAAWAEGDERPEDRSWTTPARSSALPLMSG